MADTEASPRAWADASPGPSVLSLQLDPAKAHHITVLGRKKSGKSVLAARFWASWPFDRLAIDPHREIDPGPDAVRLEPPLPATWPEPAEDQPRSTLWFPADPASPTYTDDLDRAVGLAFARGTPLTQTSGTIHRVLVWCDEVGELTSATKTPPHMRRALHQSRHRRLSLLLCGPRPIHVNPLVVSQADYLAVFELPAPQDRKRVAEVIGVELDELEHAHGQLDEHGFLWWDAAARELVIMPPLPKPQTTRSTAS